jgi:Ca2+-binding RTX toxin-like protein
VGKMRRLFLLVVLALCAVLTMPQVASGSARKCQGIKATIVGTARPELIKGSARTDVIVGLGGKDTIKGLRGGDRICGGDGGDKLVGGGGNDLLSGDAGNDTLRGGSGSDEFSGGAGSDAFIEIYTGYQGFDLVSYFFAPSGVQVDLTAGTATGGEGTDTLRGTFEDLEGSPFDDTLTGNGAPNLFRPGGGNDTVNGGGGTTDQVDFFDSPNAVIVDLTAGTATGEGTDTLTGIGQVVGSQHDDTIVGDANPNTLLGLQGNDTISGAAGNDTLYGEGWGGSGNDTLDGGDGTDTLHGGDGIDTCTTGETVTDCEG